jgi:hypothetical protein
MFVTFKSLGRLGRLGNQLFQIAATIGTACRNGCEFVFPPWPYGICFARTVPQSTSIPPTRTIREQSFPFQEISLTESSDLLGFFQSEKYFGHCQQEVRDFFTPRKELVGQIRAAFGHLRAKKTCSIHVRRTDYVGQWHGVFADLAAGDYYEKAIDQFDRDTLFLVFSDDLPWCKQRFQGEQFMFMEGLRDIADLFLMASCQGHIIANSSFSWWAAWLDPRPDKQVIAPARWFTGDHADPTVPFRAGPLHSGYHDTRDLIPETWTRL